MEEAPLLNWVSEVVDQATETVVYVAVNMRVEDVVKYAALDLSSIVEVKR